MAFGVYYFFMKEKPSFIVLQTDKVTEGDVTTEVTATGSVQPVDEVEVGTQVSGLVSKIYVDYNSQVKKGQLLAELDKTNLQEMVVKCYCQLPIGTQRTELLPSELRTTTENVQCPSD